MSAFQCSDAHLLAILHFLRINSATRENELRLYATGQAGDNLGPWHHDETWVKAMKLLFDANQVSLQARYKDEPNPFFESQYHFDIGVKPLTAVEALKACQSYAYQACEDKGWEASLACALVEKIKNAAIGSLPGYEEAKWSDFDRFDKRAPQPNVVSLMELVRQRKKANRV